MSAPEQPSSQRLLDLLRHARDDITESEKHWGSIQHLSGDRRNQGVTKELLALLDAIIRDVENTARRGATGAHDADLVFTAAGGGRVEPSNLTSRTLKPAAVKAGLGQWVRQPDGTLRADSRVTFHVFRHTCATILFRRGWNAVQVQRWLGHHKPSFILDVYVHLLDEDVPEPDFFTGIGRQDRRHRP